jgi:hypothetical protein
MFFYIFTCRLQIRKLLTENLKNIELYGKLKLRKLKFKDASTEALINWYNSRKICKKRKEKERREKS